MKKFFLLFALLLGMTSCNNDPELDTPNPEPDPRPALSTTVPVTEALDELYGLMDDVAADTRAGAAFDRARKIRDIRVSGARAATRTGAYDLPDTLVYVVNFSDDQGFAVLGAQRSLEPVYVLTESGTRSSMRPSPRPSPKRALRRPRRARHPTRNNPSPNSAPTMCTTCWPTP